MMTPVGLDVQLSQPGDDAAILGLRRGAGWTASEITGEAWVALLDGEVVGSLQLLPGDADDLLVDAVVVREAARGRGIGSGLMRTVMASRSATWWVECREELRGFYQRLGFVEVERAALPGGIAAHVEPPSAVSWVQHFACLRT